MNRIYAVFALCICVAGCQEVIRAPEASRSMTPENKGQVTIGREALRAWAMVSEDQRAIARAALKKASDASSALPSVVQPSYGFVVIDEELPNDGVALII